MIGAYRGFVAPRVYASRSAAEGSIPGSGDTSLHVYEAGATVEYTRDDTGLATDLIMADNSRWRREATPDGAVAVALAAQAAATAAVAAQRNVTLFGAAADGVTSDTAAFSAAEAAGVSPVLVTGQHYLATHPAGSSIAYRLSSDAAITMGAGGWNPRRYYREGVTPYDRKVNPASLNPAVPAEVYTSLTDSVQAHSYWINQWGYQEADTDGNLSGARTAGKIPPGQARLARTGANQFYLQGLHSGEGDGYNLFLSMGVQAHGRINLATAWSGQNSGGMAGGQINALTDKVTLYGLGDLVLDDKTRASVAMLGEVMILSRNGADGTYGVPRINYMASSTGTLDIDAAFVADGKFRQGIDLTGADISSNVALALKATQRIAFGASVPNVSATGKFTSMAYGGAWIEYTGSFLSLVNGNASMMQVYTDRVAVTPPTQSVSAFRVHGSTATAFAALGQFGAISYFSAFSSGTDNTQLLFQTALAGVERECFRIMSDGGLRAINLPTYADNAAALAASRTAGDIYRTATGELRTVV